MARVWLGVGQEQETVAVPGVGLACGDVLVAIELSTVCDSDVRTVRGHRPLPTPLVLGHESVGRVIAIGEGGANAADGTALRIGDRVVWSVTVSCGGCDRCSAGFTERCRTLVQYGHERIGPRWELTGGFASHMHLRDGTAIVRVSETLPAAVLAPASCVAVRAWSALSQGRAGRSLDGMRVLILGAGPVGLSAAAIAADRGAAVTIVESSEQRRSMARRFGADAVLPQTLPAQFALVVETRGDSFAAAVAAADIGGVIILSVSSPEINPSEFDPSPEIDPSPVSEQIVEKRLSIKGAGRGTSTDLMEVVAFLSGAGRTYPFAELVGAVHRLDALEAALSEASERPSAVRVGIVPG